MGLFLPLAEPVWKDIPNGDGLQGGTIGTWVFVRGPCGEKHVMSLGAAMALKAWLGDIESSIKQRDFEQITPTTSEVSAALAAEAAFQTTQQTPEES